LSVVSERLCLCLRPLFSSLSYDDGMTVWIGYPCVLVNVMKVATHNLRCSCSELSLSLLPPEARNRFCFFKFSLSSLALNRHLLVLVVLLLVDARFFLLVQLLLCAGHGRAYTHMLRLLVDLLHAVARGQHLVLAHSIHRVRRSHPLLAFSFAFLATALVESSVQLQKSYENNMYDSSS